MRIAPPRLRGVAVAIIILLAAPATRSSVVEPSGSSPGNVAQCGHKTPENALGDGDIITIKYAEDLGVDVSDMDKSMTHVLTAEARRRLNEDGENEQGGAAEATTAEKHRAELPPRYAAHTKIDSILAATLNKVAPSSGEALGIDPTASSNHRRKLLPASELAEYTYGGAGPLNGEQYPFWGSAKMGILWPPNGQPNNIPLRTALSDPRLAMDRTKLNILVYEGTSGADFGYMWDAQSNNANTKINTVGTYSDADAPSFLLPARLHPAGPVLNHPIARALPRSLRRAARRPCPETSHFHPARPDPLLSEQRRSTMRYRPSVGARRCACGVPCSSRRQASRSKFTAGAQSVALSAKGTPW